MTSPTTNPIVSGGAGAGLWIRVAANLSRRKVTWRLTDALLAQFPLAAGAPRSLMQKAAMGYLVELWGNIAEHTVDGVIASLPDAQLEQWAGWDGEQGAFARWLRGAHLDPETGCCREWEDFAGALQTKRKSDAQRQRDKRERDRLARELAEEATRRNAQTDRGNVGPNPTRSDRSAAADERSSNGKTPQPAPTGPYRPQLTADEIGDLARRFTIAVNKGMGDNTRMGQMYNPIHAGRGDSIEFVTFLASEGVAEWDLIERIVYSIAKGYEPERPGDQIRSLTFCRERTLAMWRRSLARAAAEKAGPIGEVSVARGKRASENSDRSHRSARSAAGALAAAAAVGLADE